MAAQFTIKTTMSGLLADCTMVPPQSFQKPLLEEYAPTHIGEVNMIWGIPHKEGLVEELGPLDADVRPTWPTGFTRWAPALTGPWSWRPRRSL